MTFFSAFLLLLATGIFLLFRGRSAGKTLILAATLAMFVWAWDPFTAMFAGTLERQFALGGFPAEAGDAIVVLSGSFYPPDAAQPETLPHYGTYLRCHHAALLFKRWNATPVVITTGWVRSGGRMVDTAPVMRQLLENEGVPASMIWSENQSQNTYENAVNTANLLRSKGVSQRIALVTEAFHMPRAYRTFQHQGFSVLPAPCAPRMTQSEGTWRNLLVPYPKNMSDNEKSLHEWIGLLWYSMSGKI